MNSSFQPANRSIKRLGNCFLKLEKQVQPVLQKDTSAGLQETSRAPQSLPERLCPCQEPGCEGKLPVKVLGARYGAAGGDTEAATPSSAQGEPL